MTITDTLHYATIGNPVSKAIIGSTTSLFSRGSANKIVSTVKASDVASASMPPLWKIAGRNYNLIRLAGLMGASAVVLGAVGSHMHMKDKDLQRIFETANRFHFFHSLALMTVPLAKYPLMTGTLMVSGTSFFTGVLYYRAFTGNKPRFSRLAPLGGTLLIAAWLSLLL